MADDVKKPEEVKQSEQKKAEDLEVESVSLDELPKEEIEKLADDKPPTRPKKKPKEAEKPAEEKPQPPPAAAEEKPKRIPIDKDEQGNPLYYDDHGNKVTGDRLKDTQAALHRTSELLKQAQEELVTYKTKEAEKKYADFEVLSEEDLAALREEDASEAKAYEQELAEVTSFYEQKEQHRKTAQWLIMLDATQEILKKHEGIEVEINPNVPFQQQPAEVQKFMVEVLKNKLDPVIAARYRPNQDGLYTKEVIEDAYKSVFLDKIIAKANEGVRTNVISDIEKAAAGRSPLDAIPRSTGNLPKKSAAEMTYEELASLSQEEVDFYLEQEKKR